MQHPREMGEREREIEMRENVNKNFIFIATTVKVEEILAVFAMKNHFNFSAYN